MKVLIINPPYSLEDRYGGRLKHFGGHAEPLGLAYVAAAVREAGHQVEILDAPAMGMDASQVAAHVRDHGFQVAGISVLTPSFRRAKETARAVAALAPKARVVMGGAHATVMPEASLRDFDCHAVVAGEGERSMVELVNALDGGQSLEGIAGVTHWLDGKPFSNPKRKMETRLDNLPKPARDLLPMDKYYLTATRVKTGGLCGTVIAGRGCPHNCAFCSHTFGRTGRFHSPQRVVEEIEELIGRYKAAEINLEADTLTTSRKHVLALCRELVAAKIPQRVQWTCESRADGLDEDVLAAMKEAGCWQVSIGVESGNDRLLKKINKGETLADIERAVGLCHKVGLSVRAFYMIGLPSETKEESLKTIEFAKKLNTDWAQFTVTIPFPGTPMFEEADSRGEIRSRDWDMYKTWSGWTDSPLPWISPGRGQDELKKLQQYAARSYYLRPRAVWLAIKRVRNLATFKKYLLGFFTLLRIKRA